VNDPSTSNNTNSHVDALTPQSDLQVTVGGPTNVVPGTLATYTLVFTNTGPSQAVGVTVSDHFPTALTGVTWSSQVTSGTGSANTTGSLSNTASITAPSGISDPNLSNNTATNTVMTLTADEHFVQGLYQNKLGRTGALAELDFWVSVLNGPNGSRALVTSAIAHSVEALRDLVDGWYVTYLGRSPQNGEEMGWVNLLQSLTQEQALSYILGSQEFFNRAQSLIATRTAQERSVQALYQLLLNRTASTAESGGWVSTLPQIGQQGVALAFLKSQEYRIDQFTRYYNVLPHRPPDTSGLQGWIFSKLDASTVRIDFEASSEFYMR
jgi:uncharacterized repeat protein (TIGR01451 family)